MKFKEKLMEIRQVTVVQDRDDGLPKVKATNGGVPAGCWDYTVQLDPHETRRTRTSEATNDSLSNTEPKGSLDTGTAAPEDLVNSCGLYGSHSVSLETRYQERGETDHDEFRAHTTVDIIKLNFILEHYFN